MQCISMNISLDQCSPVLSSKICNLQSVICNLQCAATNGSALHVKNITLHCTAPHCSVMHCTGHYWTWCHTLTCTSNGNITVAVQCSALPWPALHKNALQVSTVGCSALLNPAVQWCRSEQCSGDLSYYSVLCSALQCSEVHCYTVQWTGLHKNTVQISAVGCSALLNPEVEWRSHQCCLVQCSSIAPLQ